MFPRIVAFLVTHSSTNVPAEFWTETHLPHAQRLAEFRSVIAPVHSLAEYLVVEQTPSVHTECSGAAAPWLLQAQAHSIGAATSMQAAHWGERSNLGGASGLVCSEHLAKFGASIKASPSRGRRPEPVIKVSFGVLLPVLLKRVLSLSVWTSALGVM